MADENINKDMTDIVEKTIQKQQEVSGQTPPEQPTGAPEELQSFTEQELAGMPPEAAERYKKWADRYANSIRMESESHRRNEEAAERLRQAEEKIRYAEQRDQETRDYYDDMQRQILANQAGQPIQPTTVPIKPAPNPDEDPAAAYKYLQETYKADKEMTAKELAEIKALLQSNTEAKKAEDNEIAFNYWLDQNIFSKPEFDHVDKDKLLRRVNETGRRADPYNFTVTAREIQGEEQAKFDAKWEEYKKQKEADAANTQISQSGTPIGTARPEGDMTPQQWRDYFEKDIEKRIQEEGLDSSIK